MQKNNLSEKIRKLKEKLENSDDSFTRFAKLKKKAKENMEGSWNKAATVTFISVILSAVISFIILTIFGYCVLQLGLSYPVVEENSVPVENTVAENTVVENTSVENSVTVPSREVPSDYYLTYSILYIIFAALIFTLVYHLINTVISTIYSIRYEEENLDFGLHFKKTGKFFNKFSKLLGYKFLKLLPAILIINFSYVTYILGIYLTLLFDDDWLILVLVSVLITLIGFILAISVLFNYTFTSFIVLKEPNMDVKNTLAKSKLIMRKNKKLFFDFIFSFVGWAILSVLTFGIGFAWLIPYYQLSKYYLYEDLKSPENMKNKELKNSKIKNNKKNSKK